MTKTRAAIYARYSSDLQSDRSIEDQNRLCEEFAARNGFEVVAKYSDAARSGASLIDRDGVTDLLLDARAGQFGAVIVENLDRLSRDQADLALIFKKLSFKEIKIVAVSGGVADEMQVGFRGLMGAMYLKDLADKTRRGLAGKVAAGQSAGGKAYGYRPVKGEPGRLEIVEEEAEIVRRIFAEYAEGASARQIATDLNRDGVPPPRGAVWAANTISGDPKKMTGILRVPLYHGELVWNKLRYVKNPDTGKRVSRLNPPSEWKHVDVPELRIVDEKVWIAAQSRVKATGRGGKGHVRKFRLLSGLIKCGVCGGGMAVNGTARGRDRIVCVRHREAGACDHGRSYYLDRVEDAVFLAFEGAFKDPAVFELAIDVAIEERRRHIAGLAKERARAEGEVARAKGARERVVDAYIEGTLSKEDMHKKLPALDARIKEAERALALTKKPPVVDLHGEAVEDYKAMMSNLRILVMNEAQRSTAAREAIRGLLHSVVVHPTEPEAPMRVEVFGRLYGLIGETVAEVSVAGAGFEPAAFRL